MAEEILSNDLPALKIVSASPIVAEAEINRLLKEYAVFQYYVFPIGDTVIVTALLASKTELRKQALANIQPGGRRQ